MAYAFHHVHLKAPDPEKTANWYIKAFDFRIVRDQVRVRGDRFIRCEMPDGTVVNITGARIDEQMGEGNADVHWGLEHFGIRVENVDDEIKRLEALGARLMEGPTNVLDGPRIAFLAAPDDVRIEIVQLRE